VQIDLREVIFATELAVGMKIAKPFAVSYAWLGIHVVQDFRPVYHH
jgi:hypothetical protein